MSKTIENWRRLALVRAGAADTDVTVEVWDKDGVAIPLVGSSALGGVTLTISSTAKGLIKFLITAGYTVAKNGGWADVAGAAIRVDPLAADGVAFNFGATVDGSGTNGIATAAPVAAGPRILDPGDLMEFGGTS